MDYQKLRPVFLFIVFLSGIILLRQWLVSRLILTGQTDYILHTSVGIGINIIIISVSYFAIARYQLKELGGVSKRALYKPQYLIFPLYLAVLNLAFIDAIPKDNLMTNLLLLICYCLSIGWSEELSLRGFLQSYTIKYFVSDKKQLILAVFLIALLFGVMHLLKFDKGWYGEISQLCYATFIGFMFGILLLLTRRLAPLAIVHAIIDFAAKIDDMGAAAKQSYEHYSLVSAVIITFLVFPCLIYGLYLSRKIKWPAVIPLPKS